MGNYLISVTDLEKPIIREDILVEKEIIDDLIDKTGGLGLMVEQMIINIEKERKEGDE